MRQVSGYVLVFGAHLLCAKTQMFAGAGVSGEVILVSTTRKTHPLDRPGSLFAVKCFRRREARNADKVSNVVLLP